MHCAETYVCDIYDAVYWSCFMQLSFFALGVDKVSSLHCLSLLYILNMKNYLDYQHKCNPDMLS